MKSISIHEGSRDAYWHKTRDELRTVQRRGDWFVLAGAVALFAALLYNRERAGELASWLVTIGSTLLLIVASLWFVTTRKRRVAEARGLVCGTCAYMPHDTEITEVAETRRCPRCAASLER